MTKEELNSRLNEIISTAEHQRKEAYKQYAYANNPYKIGDTVTDHIGTVKIEKIQVHISDGISQCVYSGTELKKDGTPTIKQKHTTVFQSNIINP